MSQHEIKYVPKFDNMRARKRWYDKVRTTHLDDIAADLVEGIRAQSEIGGFRESFLPFVDLLAWIPRVFTLQQRGVHDIVGLTRDEFDALWATCSCGLTGRVPDDIAQGYRIPIVFLCTHEHRDQKLDRRLESWFYLVPGHRDPFYRRKVHAFVAEFAGGPQQGPLRQLVCTECQRFLKFHYSGKFALFRPQTYNDAASRHLVECAGPQKMSDLEFKISSPTERKR